MSQAAPPAALLLFALAGLLHGAPPPSADIPPLSASDLARGSDPLLLPLRLPGYELRVLDRRKPVTFESGGAKIEVLLPIYFYVPAAERREGLRLLRRAADDLRRAAHAADRGDTDLDDLLARVERGLDLLGQP